MKQFDIANLPRNVVIGRQTETGVEKISIDCSAWFEKWSKLEISVWHTRPDEEAAYPAVCHRDGNCVVWDVSAADTALCGEGAAEIVGMADGQKKISATMYTHIFKSITGNTTEVPDPAKPWVDEVLDAARRAEDAAASGGASPELIENAVNSYLEKNPVQGVSDEHIKGVTAEMLEEAKRSGAFDGAKGDKGDPGEKGDKGDKGDKGADYILTEADKREIAGMVEVSGGGTGGGVTDEYINSLIDAKLGVIENGSY